MAVMKVTGGLMTVASCRHGTEAMLEAMGSCGSRGAGVPYCMQQVSSAWSAAERGAGAADRINKASIAAQCSLTHSSPAVNTPSCTAHPRPPAPAPVHMSFTRMRTTWLLLQTPHIPLSLHSVAPASAYQEYIALSSLAPLLQLLASNTNERRQCHCPCASLTSSPPSAHHNSSLVHPLLKLTALLQSCLLSNHRGYSSQP